MALISKEDLKFDYSWTAVKGDNPKVTGLIDSSKLNRNEGYEMLDFINTFSENNNFSQLKSAIKVEKMIKTLLPPNIQLRTEVTSWIVNNWKN